MAVVFAAPVLLALLIPSAMAQSNGQSSGNSSGGSNGSAPPPSRGVAGQNPGNNTTSGGVRFQPPFGGSR